MLNKPKLIGNWHLGMGQSDFIGLGEMRNVDIFSKPGVVTVNNKLALNSTDHITGTPLYMQKSSGGTIYMKDNNNVLWANTNGWEDISGAITKATGSIIIWKDYLINFRGLSTDIYGPLSNSPTMNDVWESINTAKGGEHVSFLASDDIVYWGSDRYVEALEENAGQTFDPANSATYTIRTNNGGTAALDLPYGFQITAFAELNEKLMIATKNTISRSAKIFVWDKVSVDYEQVINLGDEEIGAMITVNNRLYIFCQGTNNIYYTDGLNIGIAAVIPDTINPGKIKIYSEAVMWRKGRIYFATSSLDTTQHAMIWSLQNGKLSIEHTISTGLTQSGGTGDYLIPVLLNDIPNNKFYVGWGTTATWGVDILDLENRYTGYTAFVTSEWMLLGDPLNKEVIEYIYGILTQPLAKYTGIKISYRTNHNTSTWTDLKTVYESGSSGTTDNFYHIMTLKNVVCIQFRIFLTCPTSGDYTPELLALIVK